MRIARTCLRVGKAAALADFYRDLLGMRRFGDAAGPLDAGSRRQVAAGVEPARLAGEWPQDQAMYQGHPFERVDGDVAAPARCAFPGQPQVPGGVLPVASHQQQVAELEVGARGPPALGLALQHPQKLAAGLPFEACPAAERGGFYQGPAAELEPGMFAPRETPGDLQEARARPREIVDAHRVPGSGKGGLDECRCFPFGRLVLRRQDRRKQGQTDGGPRAQARRRVLLRAARH